jgi:hypothetical protein
MRYYLDFIEAVRCDSTFDKIENKEGTIVYSKSRYELIKDDIIKNLERLNQANVPFSKIDKYCLDQFPSVFEIMNKVNQ